MEGILREPDLAEVAERLFERSFDFTGRVVYYPVRHHSPACAWHLTRVIDRYAPELVLIEGPSEAGTLLPTIADREACPPFCIYTSFDDRKGQVSDLKERYRAYYPFLAYSPELVAIRTAAERSIPVQFIDLPYAHRLINRPEREESDFQFLYNENAEYETNDYTARLTARSGCRDFAEFWEGRFELGAVEAESRSFVKQVFSLGYFMRLATPAETPAAEENRLRERYMAAEIRKCLASDRQRILVVTGAFHVAGLMEELADGAKRPKAELPSWTTPASGTTAAYLMPYTFRAADSGNGYTAGMAFPAFYQSVWEKMPLEAKETKRPRQDPYARTVLEYIVRTARFARERHTVSIPDEIQAFHMARSLAALRGKSTAGVYELLDGVRSAFVKGDRHSTPTPEIDFLLRQLSGLEVGRVPFDRAVPPLVQDFRAQCSALRIRIETVKRQAIVLEIIKKPAHRQKSRFLHRMLFLKSGFASLERGPDYVNRSDRNLARESWLCRYSPEVTTRLIDLSVYGATIEEACTTLVAREFDDRRMTADTLGRLLLLVEVMGLGAFYRHHEDPIRETIYRENDFLNLGLFLQNLHRLTHMQLLMDGGVEPLLPELGRVAWKRAMQRIPVVKQVAEDEEERVCNILHSLYSFLLAGASWSDAESFEQGAEEVIRDTFCNSRVYGLCLAIRHEQGAMDRAVFGDRVAAYLMSCLPRQAASFICGLFQVAHDILLLDDRMLETIERVIGQADDEVFLTILPDLRYAFTHFSPTDLSRLAEVIARRHGIGPERLSGSATVTAEEVVAAMRLDHRAAEALNDWNL